MKFLFLTTVYPVSPNDAYMTSELAGELIGRGHQVSVLYLSWNAKPFGKTRKLSGTHGETIIEIAPRAIGKSGGLIYKISKFILTNLHALREMRRHLEIAQFDATVSWTPAMTIALPLRCAIRHRINKHVLFIFDFFPIHHFEIGLIPSRLVYRIAKFLENHVYKKFTALICNFPGNIPYLKDNYPVSNSTRVLSTSLWSDISVIEPSSREDVRSKYNLPLNRPLAVFGGQITEGRGIEQMLGAAEYANQSQSNLMFIFVGDGRLVPLILAKSESLENIRHIPGISRDEYLALVSVCDIGMVATVEGVTSFSFPTKTIDYLRAGLKIVAAVEKGSDYLDLLEKYDLGEAVDFNDPNGYFIAAENLANNISSRDEQNIRICLEDVFHVKHAADTLLDAVN